MTEAHWKLYVVDPRPTPAETASRRRRPPRPIRRGRPPTHGLPIAHIRPLLSS